MTFPDTPEVKFSDGVTYYIYRDNSNYLYFAQVMDLNKISSDSLDLKTPGNFYRQFISSVIDPLQGKVFYSDSVNLKKVKGVAFYYKCKLKGSIYYAYEQAFRVDKRLVSYSLLSRDSLASDDEKIKTFFSTFKLTPDKEAALNKMSGLFTGIIMFASITFFGGLFIFFIKKSRKKKIYEWPGE